MTDDPRNNLDRRLVIYLTLKLHNRLAALVSPLRMISFFNRSAPFSSAKGGGVQIKAARSLFFRLDWKSDRRGLALDSPAGTPSSCCKLNLQMLSVVSHLHWTAVTIYSQNIASHAVELHSKHKANTWDPPFPPPRPLLCYICMGAN